MQTVEPEPVKRRHRSRKYSAEPLAVMPDAEAMGPALRALNAMQRRLVLELHAGPPGYGSLIRAANAAGYGGDNDLHASQMAVQLMHNDKVQAALKELGHKRINAAAFSVIKNVEAIANNLAHPQCLKAAEMLLNR